MLEYTMLSTRMPIAHSPSLHITGSARAQNAPKFLSPKRVSSRIGPVRMFFSTSEKISTKIGPSHEEMHVASAAPATPMRGIPNAPLMRP